MTMLNRDKLALALAAYRKDFHSRKSELKDKTHWEDEQYKWIAVRHFQEAAPLVVVAHDALVVERV